MKKARGERHAALRRSSACFRCRFILLALAAFFCLLPAVAQNAPSPAVVWFAEHRNLVQVDPATDQIILNIALPSESDAVAVDPADGSAWLLADRRLQKYDRSGILKQVIDLRSLSRKLDEPKYLLLNPHDSSLWVAGEKTVLRLDAGGKLVGETTLTESIRAAALGLDDHLWLVTEKQLVRLSPGLVVQASQNLRSLLSSPRQVAGDSLGNRLWLAGHGELLALDPANLAQPLLRIVLSSGLGAKGKDGENKDKDGEYKGNAGEIDALTVHPVFGTVWVVARKTLLIYDRQGQPLKQVPLKSHDLGEIEAAVFDPVGFGLWLGGKKALGHFQSNGAFVARVPVKHELEALAATPFRLRPTLSLLAPPDKTVTNNALTPLRYGLGSDCTGTPCSLEPDYTRSLGLNVDVDGQTVGPLFTLSPDEAVYAPSIRWPEGGHQVTAQATDRYGHSSDKIVSQFTIDTVPPQFVSVMPLDGSSFNTPAVTISGSVNETSANVVLRRDGEFLSMGGANFSFAVTLKPGLNSFTLTAQDPAGNATSISYRLTLGGVNVSITSPVMGANLGTSTVLVQGTHTGPANTGIIVNGQVAFTQGTQFFVTLPLTTGANTLTATATTPQGQTASHAVTVTRTTTAPDPAEVQAEPSSGIAPLTVRFRVRNNAATAITRIDADFDGNGAPDFTTTDPTAAIVYTYTAPGVYQPRITVTQGATTFTQTLVVGVNDAQQMDQVFTNIWTGMNSALAQGDSNTALSFLNENAKRKYQRVFTALLPQMPQIIASYSPLRRVSISESIGEYAINRTINGRNKIFLIYFLKDTDGVWRLDAM